MNSLGLYGYPELMRLHDSLVMKRPSEFEAAARIYDPTAPRFIDAPPRAFEIWCPGCHKLKKPDMFHHNRARPTGRHTYCKACRNAGCEKAAKRSKHHSRWYRG